MNIEQYYSKPSMEAAVLTAALNGDTAARDEGLGRMSQQELRRLEEALDDLTWKASALITVRL